MKIKSLALIFAGVVLVCAVLFFGMGKIQYENREAALRSQFKAKQRSVQIRFDAGWKNASQQAQVTQKYAADFREVYTGIMTGRYRDGEAQMAKFVAEANPTLDAGVYRQLMDTIRSERLSTEQDQNELLAIVQEHDNLRSQVPGKWFVGSVAPLEARTITSSRTEETFESGRDDTIDVFGGGK